MMIRSFSRNGFPRKLVFVFMDVWWALAGRRALGSESVSGSSHARPGRARAKKAAKFVPLNRVDGEI